MIAVLLSITALAWDGERLYVARPGGVEVWKDGKLEGRLGDEKRPVFGLAVHGKRLAESGGRAGEKGWVRVWEDGRCVKSFDVHADLVYRVAWSPDGRTLYTAGGDRKLGVIDVESGRVELLEGHTGPVLALAVSGDLVVTGSADRTIRVWKDRKPVRVLRNHFDAVNALAFSPDGTTLASGSSDRTVRVWQPGIGRMVRIVKVDGAVLDLAWTAQGLHSAASDGKVRRIASDDARIERVIDGHADAVNALAPAGGRLWSGDAASRLLSHLLGD